MNLSGKDPADLQSGRPGNIQDRAEPRARSPAPPQPLRLSFGAFELDEADARLLRHRQPVPLPPKPFAVLCELARTPGTLVTKNALLDTVWGHRFVTDSVLKSTVSELRAALQDNPRQPSYVETVSRRGYRFIALSSPLSSPTSARRPAVESTTDVRFTDAHHPLIGRSDAFEKLREAWQAAGSGRRKIVWIAGEAGVGKTTLIEHFVAEVGEVHCARGQCVEQFGAGEPYMPVLQALTELCHRDPSLPGLIRSVAPTWLVQLPWLSEPAERESLRREISGAGQARMLRELGELLERYTEHRPLLLVTEDLHWSDYGTVQLIDYIARRRGAARLLWLASFRLTEIIAADHPLRVVRHELRLHGLADELVLDAFSEQEVADYIANRAPALTAEEALVRALHGRTEGLPLFVADVVNDLVAHEEFATGGERSALRRLQSTAIPETLTGIIEGYLRKLTPDQRALLDVASVCGTQFRLDTVAGVMGCDIASVAESCAELARLQRWLSEVPLGQHLPVTAAAYAFRHALYREVLYERLGAVARVELHRRIAIYLERERDCGDQVGAAELASHFHRGHEPLQAARYYAEAAEAALLRFGPAEAMRLTGEAFAILPQVAQSSERTTLELTLATLQGVSAAHLLGFSSAEAKHAFQHAQALLHETPQHRLRGPLLHELGYILYLRGELDEVVSLAERTEALAAETQDRVLLRCACIMHALVQNFRGRPRLAREWLERIPPGETFDEVPHPAFGLEPGVTVLGLAAIVLLEFGFADQARERMRAAHARAARLRQPIAKMLALWFDALLEVRMDNAERVGELADELEVVAEGHALVHGQAAHRWFRGWATAHRGDPQAAYRLIQEGDEMNVRLGMAVGRTEVLGYAVEALIRAGDARGARRELDAAMRFATEVGERLYLVQLLLLEARIADLNGEPDRARAWVHRALEEAQAQETPWLQLTALLALCEREDATAADRTSLQRVLDLLTEGLDTGLIRRAQRVLEAGTGA